MGSSNSSAALADALRSMISSKDARTASTGALLSRLASGDVADQLLLRGSGAVAPLPNAFSSSSSSAAAANQHSNSVFANEIKHLQQKIIDELKTGVDPITVSSGPASQQLALFNSLAQKQLQGTGGGGGGGVGGGGGASAMSDPISGRASVIGGGIYGGPGPLRPNSVTAYGGVTQKSAGPLLLTGSSGPAAAAAGQYGGFGSSRQPNFYNDFGGLSGSLGRGPANYRHGETRLGSLERYMDRNRMWGTAGAAAGAGYGSLPFKSYEYESLNPVRNYGDSSYRLMRPYSSVSYSAAAAAAAAAAALENDLRESMIPNHMNHHRHLQTGDDFLVRVFCYFVFISMLSI